MKLTPTPNEQALKAKRDAAATAKAQHAVDRAKRNRTNADRDAIIDRLLDRVDALEAENEILKSKIK